MKKTIIIASLLLVTAIQANAQKEFKLAKTSGKLVINNISNLTVEGYDGKEIIISSSSSKEEKSDPRAEGLTALGNSGFDNTGLGVSLTEKNQIAEMTAIDKTGSLKVKVLLPYTIALSILTNTKYTDSAAIKLSNLKSEVDASLRYESIKLTNVVGPLSIKTMYGNIESALEPSFKGPISLVSVYGFLDVTVSSTAKADLMINTKHERLFASKELKLVISENKPKGLSDKISVINDNKTVTTTNTDCGCDTKNPEELMINGTLNGGGEKIVLKSTYGKIYLRK